MWSDEDLPTWWESLGVPGLFDVHVHFLPPRMQRSVWAAFEDAGPLIGREWPIHYRLDEQERVRILRDLGVRRFSALAYAHRPDMAESLNDWAAEFADRTPECLRSATFFPEPQVTRYVEERLRGERGPAVEVFKIHVQVGDFDPNVPVLADAWGMVADAGVPVVMHVGSGPMPAAHTGPDTLARLLQAHPQLRVVVAHMGAPEYADFLDLAERHDRVLLDTTIAFTDFTEEDSPFPPELRPRLLDLQDRILLGSDFPSIPHPYAHQVEALARLDLGDDWLRAVCWDNGASLLGRAGGAAAD